MHCFYLKVVVFILWLYRAFGNVEVPMIIDTKLALRHVVEAVFNGKLHRCADKCLSKTDCQSFSFRRSNKRCEMYRSNSNSVPSGDKVTQSQTVLIDIGHWPASRTGACWNKPCAENMLCVPHGASYVCQEDEEIGCKSYVLPEHGVIKDVYGDVAAATGELMPIGSAIGLNCNEPYFVETGDLLLSWLSRCETNQRWNKEYSCYTVEELCYDPILEKFYPTKADIAVTSAVPNWSETDLFLSSGPGWIPATNDGTQYFQILFDDVYQLGGVVTMGGENGNWITSFRINYSSDCVHYKWMMETDGVTVKEFPGNDDPFNVATHYFAKPTRLRCLKIYPTGYEGGKAMRLEVLACVHAFYYS